MKFENNNYPNNLNDINNESLDLNLLYKVLLREKKVILLITTISTLISITFSIFQKPIYKGNFEIVVRDNKQNSLNSRNSMIFELANIPTSSQSSTQELILKSPLVLNPIFESVKRNYKSRGIDINGLSYKDWLRTKLKINFIDKSDVLEINFIDEDKGLILNTLRDISSRYQNFSKRDRNKNLKSIISFLEKEQKDLKLKSEKSMSELSKFSIDNGLGDIDGFVDIGSGNNNSLQNLSRNFLSQMEQNSIGPLNYTDLNIQDLDNSKSGQRFSQQFNMLETYESRYTDLSSKLKPNSRILKNLELKIANLKSSLKRPNEILLKYRELKRISQRDNQTLIDIEGKLVSYKLENARQLDPWELISTPRVEEGRIAPKRKKNVAITFLISFVIASIIAYIKDKRSGYIFDFIPLKSRINCSYLYDLSINKKLISKNIVNSIVNKYMETLDEKGKIGVINFDEDLSLNKNNCFIDDDKKFINLDIQYENSLNKFDKIIILVSSFKKNIKDIDLLNKYIKIYEDKIIGWFYIIED